MTSLKQVSPEGVQALARKILESSQLQILVAGEPAHARTAVKANNLGALKPLSLSGR
jgi:hypothetical protein